MKYKLWEKNYLYSLGLFVAAFYLCLFLVASGSFRDALEAEREAVLAAQGLAARAIASDILTVRQRDGDNPAAEAAIAQSYASYYYKRGVSLSFARDGRLLAGRDAVPPGGARKADTLRAGGAVFMRVHGALPGLPDCRLSYKTEITGLVDAQRRFAAALVGAGAAVAAAVALGLYGALSHLYRPMDQLAHELRTSLTAICGYGEYLQLANASEGERYEATAFIIRESRRLTDIAERLLILGNLREGRLRFEEVEAERLFEAAARAFPGVTWEGGGQRIRGDGALLQSLLNNLVKNAREAGASRVCLACGEGRVTVTDNGRGMDEETLDLARTAPRRGEMQGTRGMGLALCHRIAALHKARLTILSEPGVGTCVTLDFTTS